VHHGIWILDVFRNVRKTHDDDDDDSNADNFSSSHMELPKSQPKKRSVQFATTALEAMRLVVSRRYDSFRRGCQKRWTYVRVVFLGSRRRVGVRIVFFRKYVPVGVGTYCLYLVVGFAVTGWTYVRTWYQYRYQSVFAITRLKYWYVLLNSTRTESSNSNKNMSYCMPEGRSRMGQKTFGNHHGFGLLSLY
jgi:hypothetical protein